MLIYAVGMVLLVFASVFWMIVTGFLIAFIGFDDLPLAMQTYVKLTTVHQPITNLGVKAVELLMDVIANGPKPVRHIILGTELIVRESCGAARIKVNS